MPFSHFYCIQLITALLQLKTFLSVAYHCKEHISSFPMIYYTTGAPKLINSDLFLEKRATVPIKTQGVQRSSSGKMSTF